MPSAGLSTTLFAVGGGPRSTGDKVSVGGFMVLWIKLNVGVGPRAAAGASDRDFGFEPIVALFLEFQGKGLVAALHDAAVVHHVHEVGHDVVEEALVMRDHEHAQRVAAEAVDAVGDDA